MTLIFIDLRYPFVIFFELYYKKDTTINLFLELRMGKK